MSTILEYLPIPVVVASIVLASIITYIYLQSKKDHPPQLFHGGSSLSQYVIQKMKILREPFRPFLIARNHHLQTLLPHLLPDAKFEFQRELVPLEDGGTIALDWGISGLEKLDTDSPIMIGLPGMTADANSMSHLLKLATQNGFRIVVFNKRGLGHSPLTSPKLQSVGDPHDLRYVVKIIRHRYPHSYFVAVGNSAGSAVLASYFGVYLKDPEISAGVFISPAYLVWEAFSGSMHWPYDYLLLRGLKAIVKEHSKMLSKVLDISTVMNAKTVNEFDEAVYCKIYGYRDLSEYWNNNEPMRNIGEVTVPMLCINSADDPVCVKEVIDFNVVNKSRQCMIAYTERGGHCGFSEGCCMESWSYKVAVQYCLTVIQYLNRNNNTYHGK